jgi:hypothetical protein
MVKDTLKKSQKAKKSITLENNLEDNIRKIQARLIERTNKNWSLSIVLNMLVAAGIQQTKKMNRNDWQKIKQILEKRTVNFDDSFIMDLVKKLG